MLKFDFYFFLGFTIQFLVVVPRTSDAEFYLTIAAIPVTVGLLFLGAFWTRRENVVGMVFTIVRDSRFLLLGKGYLMLICVFCNQLFYFAALGYFLFKMVRMYASDVRRVEDYRPVRPNLTTFAVITILLLVLTIVNACWCTSNFDKGLKNHILGRSNSVRGDKKSVQQSEMPALSGQVPSRMEID